MAMLVRCCVLCMLLTLGSCEKLSAVFGGKEEAKGLNLVDAAHRPLLVDREKQIFAEAEIDRNSDEVSDTSAPSVRVAKGGLLGIVQHEGANFGELTSVSEQLSIMEKIVGYVRRFFDSFDQLGLCRGTCSRALGKLCLEKKLMAYQQDCLKCTSSADPVAMGVFCVLLQISTPIISVVVHSGCDVSTRRRKEGAVPPFVLLASDYSL